MPHGLSWDRTSDCLRHSATCRAAGKCGGVGPWEFFSLLRCSWETVRLSNKIVSCGVPCTGLPRCGSLLSALRGYSLGHRPALRGCLLGAPPGPQRLFAGGTARPCCWHKYWLRSVDHWPLSSLEWQWAGGTARPCCWHKYWLRSVGHWPLSSLEWHWAGKR